MCEQGHEREAGARSVTIVLTNNTSPATCHLDTGRELRARSICGCGSERKGALVARAPRRARKEGTGTKTGHVAGSLAASVQL